jgi:hypothetical protein
MFCKILTTTTKVSIQFHQKFFQNELWVETGDKTENSVFLSTKCLLTSLTISIKNTLAYYMYFIFFVTLQIS